ncbi:MAG: GNAT family N-acetyltransferase, partial [Treponema sp.]|nr:GNAT family N-acetyltransferase [Treponema sp.]
MSSPFVYYRIESLNDLKHFLSGSVSSLDWRTDLSLIQRFYDRFGNHPINPDEFEQYVGNPLAIIIDGDIVSFAIPLSFRDDETEIGGVATAPNHRNKGYCKALI